MSCEDLFYKLLLVIAETMKITKDKLSSGSDF